MRKRAFLGILGVSVAILLSAQEKAKPPRPREILDLIGYAQAAPPEFAADALIRIASSDKVADNAWKRELLEQALALAASAQYKVKRPDSAAGGDNHWGYFSYAFELEMDTLSLQWRAIRALHRTDPARARELFRQIPPPHLEPLTCQDGLTYDVGPFYETLSGISRDENVEFLEPYVMQINSHAQVGPVVHAISQRKNAPRDLEKLTAALIAALGQIEHDPRSFSNASVMEGISLAQVLRGAGLSPEAFLAAYHGYIEKHLNARRCKGDQWSRQDYIPSPRGPSSGKMADQDPYLDGILRILYDKDRKIEFDDGQPDNDPFWATPESSKLLQAVLALRKTSSGKAASDADKQGIEWQTALSDFRNNLDQWKAAAEKTPEHYFYEKCTILTALLEAVPRSDVGLRTSVVESFVTFLLASPIRVTSRIEWWRQALGLLEHTPEAPAVFARSQDPVMWLYVSMEKVLGHSTP
jgi:hypothetical protein